jgi:hypothetical protein
MNSRKVLEDAIRKLRRKKTVCICIIVYAALCVIAFHSFTSIAVGLIVIAVAAVKLKKYNEEIKTGEGLLNTVEWFEAVEHDLGIKYEEEYDDPNATYSTADLLGTSSDDEDDAGEEDEESDDEEFEFDDEEFEEDDEEIIEYDLGLDDYFKQREEEARKYEEEDDGITYSTADLLGTSSSKTTKKTKNTKTTKTRKPRK